MTEPEVPQGCRVIPLWKTTYRDNFHPENTIWEICDYTVVSECDFCWLNQWRWIRKQSSKNGDYCAHRMERLLNGQLVDVFMAREILGLPRGAGHGGDQADHKNHRTLENTLDNLRIATSFQSVANRQSWSTISRFKGVMHHKYGFQSRIVFHRIYVYFPLVTLEVEAGLMHFYASTLLRDEFSCDSEFSSEEMPSEERQNELYQMVIDKLVEKGLADYIIWPS